MALQTKTITGSTSSNWIFETIVTENSTSIENNTSSVTVEHFLSHHYAGSYLAGSCTVSWNCNGQEESETKTINSGSLSSYQKFSLGSRTFTVRHNSDGKKIVSVGGSMSTTQFNPNSASSSGSMELTTIPRASDIAVSNTDLGQNIPITIGKKVDTFTSTLTYTIGTLTGTIVEKTNLSNYPWVMSSTLINQIKNAYPNTGSYAKGGVEAKVTCKTYNGTTLIGTKEATFKLYITDKPVISSATRTELNIKISALTTNVLRHASQNKFTITATAPTGASIIGYRVKNGTQDSGLSTSNVVNLNDIQTYYEESNALKTKFIVTCVDSRGNESEEFPVVCDFTNYIQVSINKTDVSIKRSSGTSNDCKIYATGNFFNGKIGTTDNTIAFKVRYKLKTATTWGSWITLSTTYTDNTFKINNVAISATFDYTKNYDIELMATDKIGESDDYSKVFVSSVPTEKHHSKGAWIRELSTDKFKIGNNELTENKKVFSNSDVSAYTCSYLNERLKYSETETVIGEWIDGKPLYQKVLKITSTVNSTSTDFAHNIENVDLIFVKEAFVNQVSSSDYDGWSWSLPVTLYQSNTEEDKLSVAASRWGVRFYVQTAWGTAWIKYVVLNYTKTTD